MPANKINYIVLYRGESQVFGTASKQIALETPPPTGIPIEDKHILFVSFQPDNNILVVHPLPRDEVVNAPLKIKESKSE